VTDFYTLADFKIQFDNFYSASAFSAIQSVVLAIIRPSVRLSVCHTLALCQNGSCYNNAVLLEDSPMTLVSSWLPSARNFRGTIGSEGAE